MSGTGIAEVLGGPQNRHLPTARTKLVHQDIDLMIAPKSQSKLVESSFRFHISFRTLVVDGSSPLQRSEDPHQGDSHGRNILHSQSRDRKENQGLIRTKAQSNCRCVGLPCCYMTARNTPPKSSIIYFDWYQSSQRYAQ